MGSRRRKNGNVVSISSCPDFDAVTEAELLDLASARRQARSACIIAVTKQMCIEERLRRGAKMESSEYSYDLASGDIIRRS